MQISVAITLGNGEVFPHTPEEAAQAIVDAFDDVTVDKDHVSVSVLQSASGSVGYLPPSPPPPGFEPPPAPDPVPVDPVPPEPTTKPPKEQKP